LTKTRYVLKINIDLRRDGNKVKVKGTLDGYISPLDYKALYDMLISEVTKGESSVGEYTLQRNVDKLNEYKSTTNRAVITRREFVRKVLRLGRAEQYNPIIRLLEDGEYIRVLEYPPGSNKVYIVIDTEAHICGNCPFYMSKDCPKHELFPKPWDDMCEKGILLAKRREVDERRGG